MYAIWTFSILGFGEITGEGTSLRICDRQWKQKMLVDVAWLYVFFTSFQVLFCTLYVCERDRTCVPNNCLYMYFVVQ